MDQAQKYGVAVDFLVDLLGDGQIFPCSIGRSATRRRATRPWTMRRVWPRRTSSFTVGSTLPTRSGQSWRVVGSCSLRWWSWRHATHPSPYLRRTTLPTILITTPPLVIRNGNTGKTHVTQPLPHPWTRMNHTPSEVCRSFFCLVEFFSSRNQNH